MGLQVPAATHQDGHFTRATHSQAWVSQLHQAAAKGRAPLVGAGVVAAAAEAAATVQSDLDAAPRVPGPAEAPAGGKRARKGNGKNKRQRRRNGIGERRKIW